ncbi:hypothetical protein [Mastigocladopsis repens]|uniref:hypothetical protein n=1 Tax=Mastigocladopsis repens TaxID=221287 RepID=UPI0002E008AC|nr:hypothetical protein [Mastigocladopsis repens]
MTQKARKTDKNKQDLELGQKRYLQVARITNHKKVSYTWGKAQTLTDLTRFKKAEAVDATPQDLSIVLRWAGGMRVLAGPATLD